ncbi:hypothetical protein TNCV_4071691 [Trichonephila clavipes]|uniref:Uncharacterized protein n=1 Tax=Trichonephila clavipes TaxID=2585209 RepID=A0A8X6W8R8_TRICX|nr:hypothetical protein TNCV_4071691 [Trichonephila clavipes]
MARRHTPVTTIDELCHREEAAWASVPVHAIQSLFNSIPRRIQPEMLVLGRDYSGSMHANLITCYSQYSIFAQ